MTNRDSFMHMLRKERHPLAALGMLAIVMRLVIIVLGTSAAADQAEAGIFATCQSYAEAGSSQTSLPGHLPHAADTCVCGLACLHGLQAAALAPTAPLLIQMTAHGATAKRLPARNALPPSSSQATDPIRGPPVSLI